MSDQAPTVGERRIFGDQLAEWDGQGWAPVNGSVPRNGETARVDSNSIIGFNHDWVADKASKLPESLRYPAAFVGSLLGHVLESVSAPENVATAGASAMAGRLPTSPAALPDKPLPVSHPPTPIRDAIRMAGAGMKQVPAHGVTGGVRQMIGSAMERVPVPKTFQDLPLAQQAEFMGEAGPVPMRRSGSPPVVDEVPFHQRAVYEQMRQLPENGAVPSGGRVSSPPPSNEVPFHQQPVYQQMRQLPDNGPIPKGGRASSPPTQQETPFHQRPVYQQMAADVPDVSVRGTTRSQMPPMAKTGASGHQRMINELMDSATTPGGKAMLSDFDSKFIDSVSSQLKAGRELSEKQSNLLYRLYAKAMHMKETR